MIYPFPKTSHPISSAPMCTTMDNDCSSTVIYRLAVDPIAQSLLDMYQTQTVRARQD